MLLAKDVKHSFSLPINVSAVKKMRGVMVQPCDLANQFTLVESGDRVPKSRLKQDLSHSITAEKISVDKRIDMGQYP